MAANGIPGVEPLGPGHETLRFVIGIVVYVIALGGLVAYLIWKLPRTDQGPGEDSSGQTTESEE